jgi:geranylgeranylglycerol-phosphate geranylgeranyltransferase
MPPDTARIIFRIRYVKLSEGRQHITLRIVTVASIANHSQGMKGLQAALQLLRPLNLVIIFAGTILGGVLGAGPGVLLGAQAAGLWLAAASAMLVAAGGNSINDYFDIAIDRVNRPDRPLPSGRLSPAAALLVWGVCSGAGIMVAAAVTLRHAMIALAAVAVLYLYSRYWKRSLLAGNLAVSLLMGTVLLYGGLAVYAFTPALVGASFAILTTLAREIIKDVEDVSGDAAADANTLAVVYGPRRAAGVASMVLALTIAATPFPYLMLGYSGLFLLVVSLADGFMLRALWLLQLPRPEETAEQASRLLKIAMVVGIAALATTSIP